MDTRTRINWGAYKYRLPEGGAEVVVAGHHVTRRRPDDLTDFCRGVLEVMSR